MSFVHKLPVLFTHVRVWTGKTQYTATHLNGYRSDGYFRDLGLDNVRLPKRKQTSNNYIHFYLYFFFGSFFSNNPDKWFEKMQKIKPFIWTPNNYSPNNIFFLFFSQWNLIEPTEGTNHVYRPVFNDFNHSLNKVFFFQLHSNTHIVLVTIH